MARAEMRAAVSGAEPEKKPRGKRATSAPVEPDKDLDRAAVQEKIMRPAVLKFKAGEKTVIVPLEYTIEDVLDRGVFDDAIAYVRLVGVEVSRMCPELKTLGLEALVQDEYSGYLEAALMRSAVKRNFRDLLARIAHVQDQRDAADRPVRPSLADIEKIGDVDYLVCAIQIYLGAIRRMAQAKNAARTASA